MKLRRCAACAIALVLVVQSVVGQGYSDSYRQNAELERQRQAEYERDAQRRYDMQMIELDRERLRDERAADAARIQAGGGSQMGQAGSDNSIVAVAVFALVAALVYRGATGPNREVASGVTADADSAWQGRQSKAVCAAQMQLRTARFNYSGVPEPRINALCACVANRALTLLTPAEQRLYLMSLASGFDGIHPERLGYVFEPCAATPTEQADLAGVWTQTGIYPNSHTQDRSFGTSLVITNKCSATLVMYVRTATSRDRYVRLVLDPGRVFIAKHLTSYGSPIYYHIRQASNGALPMPAFDPSYPTVDPRGEGAEAARLTYFARSFPFKEFRPAKLPTNPDHYGMDLKCST